VDALENMIDMCTREEAELHAKIAHIIWFKRNDVFRLGGGAQTC
jgi:hypothetical protein